MIRTATTLLLSALPGLGAQELVVQNLAPGARSEWVRCVVPFASGTVHEAPALRVGDRATVWTPLGARWGDGSWRQALCFFRQRLDGYAEARLRLRSGRGPDPAGSFAAPPQLFCRVRIAGTETRRKLAFVRLVEDNPAVRTGLYRARVGDSGLVCEVLVETFRGQAHQRLSLGLFFSAPGSEDMQREVERCHLECGTGKLTLRHPLRLGMAPEADPGRYLILQDITLGDGQGIRRLGIWQPTSLTGPAAGSAAAAALVPLLAATSWRDSGAYGPFGTVPSLPPWLQGEALRRNLARRHAAFARASIVPGHPLQAGRFGLAKNPGQTGSQEDFGLLKVQPVAASGMPSFLHELELSLQQEACRPVHFFEADGSIVRASRHPDWVVWSSRTHWNCSASKDRLGKPCPAPRFESHGWRGKDRQHWSSNNLCGAYLLSGEPWLRREIEHEIQLFLAMQRTEPGVATSSAGAPRAVGRMLLAGCWLYLCSGDEALYRRLHARVHKVYHPQWQGRSLPAEAVRPMAVRKPDPRILQGAGAYWSPWEESLAATGLAGFYRLSGDAIAGEMARSIAQMVLVHGWRLHKHRPRIAYAMRWQEEGKPLPEERYQRARPEDLRWASGGIAIWSLPAVSVARFFARRDGATALTDRADAILRGLRRGPRKPGREGWTDARADWDAVR